MEQQRMLLAVVLSIAILFGYQYFFMPGGVQPPLDNTTASTAGNKQADTKAQQAQPALPIVPAAITTSQSVEKDVKVSSDIYTVVLSSKGGTVKSVELKKYKDADGNNIVLKGETVLPPFALGLDKGFQLAGADFSVKGADTVLTHQSGPATVVFEYASGGLAVRRTYTFKYGEYGINLRDETQGMDSYMITLGKDFGIIERDSSIHFGPVVLKDADREEFTAGKIKEPKTFKDGIRWIAQEDKYFFSSLVPKSGVQDATVWEKDKDALVALKMKGGVNDYLLYAGPKDRDQLEKLGLGLEHIVDFGFFSIIARPFFWVLKLLDTVFHNYGISIIILTILVRIPFIPLINKGQASMKRLQELQPRMTEIKEKYKNDPQRMQKETMELYKKHKVNPVGGCLPMLLQIPVFFALYKVLLIAIELRGAPFAFWINDLSQKDPYYVLPVIMGVTMLIQQKMTPSGVDPMQQKLMMLMPVIFTFMFLTFPSGLVLYWLVSNVLSIIQQYYVNKKTAAQAA
jgi:YidC/Oxa1 family membrane protein insertase